MHAFSKYNFLISRKEKKVVMLIIEIMHYLNFCGIGNKPQMIHVVKNVEIFV